MEKQTGVPKVGPTTISIVENIYGIIDTKIQYIDYRSKELVRPLLGDPTQPSEKGIISVENSDSLQWKEQWFLAFEKYSRRKRKLLFLRNHLNSENALLILILLAEDQFIHYSQKDLEYLLGINQRNQAA